MIDQTTEPIELDAKRADQLTPGDHVIEEYDGGDKPAKVLHAAPYRDGNGTPRVSLMLDTLDGLKPLTVDYLAWQQIELATAEQLADMQAGKSRTALVKALRRLADDIVTHKLPVPRNFLHIGGVVESRAALEVWARFLDVEIVAGGTEGNIPAIRKDVKAEGGPAFTFGWQSPSEPKPEPEPVEVEQEWLFTFGAGQTFDGRFVRFVGTYDATRSRMNRIFGHAWCAQYDWRRFDEEGLPARLTELPAEEWPAHADEQAGLDSMSDQAAAMAAAEESGVLGDAPTTQAGE